MLNDQRGFFPPLSSSHLTQWTKDFEKSSNDSGDLVNTVFRFWHFHNVYPSSAEFEANIVMLLFAGTHNLENVLGMLRFFFFFFFDMDLGHCVRLLLQHPAELDKIRPKEEEEVDPHLIMNAIDEVLRFCPAIRIVPRTALKDITLENGTDIFFCKAPRRLKNQKK